MKRKICFTLLSMLLCTVVCILAFAGKGGGNVAPPLQKCADMYTRTTNVVFSRIKLSYNVSQYGTTILGDMMELQQAHWEIMDPTSGKGTITQLSCIMENADNYPSDRKPLVKVECSGTNCSQNIMHAFKTSELAGNILYNVPDFGAAYKSMSFTIKTIKSTMWGLQLVWNPTVNINGALRGDMVLDTSSKTDCSAPAFTKILKGKKLSDPILTRAGGNNTLYLIDNRQANSLSSLMGETIDTVPSDELIFSPTLKQRIYSGGEYKDELMWSKPTAIVAAN